MTNGEAWDRIDLMRMILREIENGYSIDRRKEVIATLLKEYLNFLDDRVPI